MKVSLMDTSPHDAWYEAFGRAFNGPLPDPLLTDVCSACGEHRNDILKKGRLICVRCAGIPSKKPKLDGTGKAGPSGNQAVLITESESVYAGPIAAPAHLPEGSRMDLRHGEAFVLAVLYEPPPPPFYLMHLAMNSDEVLGNTRLTRCLDRVHIGGLAPSIVNQPIVRRVADCILSHPDPRRALRTLNGVHQGLTRGPAASQDTWGKAMDERDGLVAQSPDMDLVFDERGRWLSRPGDNNWRWIEPMVSARLRGLL